MFLKKALAFCVDILFPVFCVECRVEGEWWCDSCRQVFPKVREVGCPLCRMATLKGEVCPTCKVVSSIDGLTALFNYSEKNAVARLIKEFKYHGATELREVWQKVFAEYFDSFELPVEILPEDNEPVCVIPLPLHPKRERERGFNQSQYLAESLASVLKKQGKNTVVTRGLVRIKNTAQQAKLSGEERRSNMHKAFMADKLFSVPKTAIIVDDVYTTGSTLQAAAEVLKEKGVKRVWGVVLARG